MADDTRATDVVPRPCASDIYVGPENVGDEWEPDIRVMATCNHRGGRNCGWSTEVFDEDGDRLDPRDWWIVGQQFDSLSALHRDNLPGQPS